MSIVSTTPVLRTSLAELVYTRLLDAIAAGTLESGTHLNVADIARDLQVSPSPVREALLRLATEGLVANNTNRRATVVSFSVPDVIEIFQVREILECGASRLAAVNVSDDALATMRTTIEHCAALGGDPSRKKEMLDLDNLFHQQVADAAGNRTLSEEIVRISRRVRVMQWLRLPSATMSTAYPEHRAVIKALERRDPDAAAVAMASHVRVALTHIVKGLEDAPMT